MRTKKLQKMAMSAKAPSCCITVTEAGYRLDVAVGLLFPAASARARRRLWDSHQILVNGKARPCGYMVKTGDTLSAHPLAAIGSAQEEAFQPWLAGEQPPHVVAEQQNLVFIYKPSGLHTAQLADRGGPSLEAQLAALLPAPSSAQPPQTPQDRQDIPPATLAAALTPRLVNRLDCGTSGLVVVARDAQCAAQWQRMEDAGLCEKHYLTLLCGHLPAPIVLRHDLDMDSRRVTRVLPTENTNPLRHSRFSPVGTLSADALRSLRAQLHAPSPDLEPPHWPALDYSTYTVALCTIAKGARHQIRAHASHAGFPLWGDSLYAPVTTAPEGRPAIFAASSHHFLLHHGRLIVSGAIIHCLPVWFPLLPPDIQAKVRSAWQITA